MEFVEKAKAGAATEVEKVRERERAKDEERRTKGEGQKRAGEIAGKLPTQGVIVENVGEGNAELLRTVVDALRPKFTSGIVVLGGVAEGKVSLLCYVTPDLVQAGKHAGKIVGELAKICGGGGGGKPDLAQAGGKQPEKLAEALAAVPRIVG